ncbi:MAG: mannose-1-phosphate guanylyltransferase [Anaerolineae bacterium]
MEHYYAVIMAGGGGTRLWPLSRADQPKQLHPLLEEHSMFRSSVERLAPLFAPDHIYVVTGAKYVEAMRADAREVPPENFIAEPFGRDSGPAAALGVAVVQARDPEAVVVLLTADHFIANKERFRAVLAAGAKLAQTGPIVTLGISPSFPATSFGYIRRGESLGPVDGFDAYHSLGFTEKPDHEHAVEFLTSGTYSWNSGMFIWTTETAMEELDRQQPNLHAAMRRLQAFVDTPDFETQLAAEWENLNRISLDYAVMEGARHMAVIPVDIGWSDVGSWDAIYDLLPADEDGNILKGNGTRLAVDTHHTLVYSDKLTVTIGADDLIVVDTPDALLICRRDRAQDVRTVVNMLKERGASEYL